MNRTELVAAMAEKAGVSKKDADNIRAAREGKNPRTGEKITIAASKVPAFKAGKAFKDLLK